MWKQILVIYILLLVTFVAVKFNGSLSSTLDTIQSNKEWREQGELSLNLVPFKTIASYVQNVHSGVSLLNILGNIIPFIPLGFVIPMAYPALRRLKKTMLVCLLLIGGIELFQFASYLRSFDIDDVILNLISCLIGYLLFLVYKKGFKISA